MSAACSARRGCSPPATSSPPGSSTPGSSRRSRTRPSGPSWPCRRTSACSRPPTGSSAARPGTWTSSTSSAASAKAPGNLAVRFRNPSGTIEFTPAALRGGRPHPDRADDLRAGVPVPAVGDHPGGAQADHPVAQHGPLPGRPGHAGPGRVPRHRGVLVRPGRRLRGGGGPAGRAGLHLPPAGRYEPGLPQRPGTAGRDRRARRGCRASAPSLHPAGQCRDRGAAGRPGGDHPHVPGELPVLVGRRGRLRLRRRGAVQRAGRGRLLPGVRRRAVGRVRAAAVRAPGQDGRARPGHHQEAARWRPRTA